MVEKAEKGELTLPEFFGTVGTVGGKAGIGFDFSGYVSSAARGIDTASGAVDVLRQHGIQDISELGRALGNPEKVIELIIAFDEYQKKK